MAPVAGVTPPPQDGSSYRFLSDVIVARGFVEPAAMKGALQASLSGRSLTELLVERGAIDELDLARAVAEHHRLDHVDLDVFAIDGEAATLVDAATARRLGALPIAFHPDGALVVAVHDPNDLPALREIGRLADRAIQPAVASRSQVDAAIDALHPSAPPPPLAFEGDAVAREKHLRAVRADGAPTASTHPADLLRPAPLAPQMHSENEDRARAAEELARIAQARAAAADARAAEAENMIAGANARAEGLMAAATAANEALARLVGNCELLEREATAREGEMQALRSELKSERAERVRLEQQSREPLASDELLALHVRIAELERELDEARALAQAPPPTADAPPRAAESYPPPAAEVPAPAPAEAFAAAPAEAFAPTPAEAFAAPPAEAFAPAPGEAFAPAPGEAFAPQVAQASVVEPPAAEQPQAAAPRSELTIDILGEPGVPYVSALAPMPPVAAAAVAKAKTTKSAAKARGLRRLIGALKRG
ncbi:MAG: type pilus assembly protein PilB [Solirubrobacteraceae bacterium]|nr:type pilus assembly protein PilB [Solirubrobacteraceae bacterium]